MNDLKVKTETDVKQPRKRSRMVCYGLILGIILGTLGGLAIGLLSGAMAWLVGGVIAGAFGGLVLGCLVSTRRDE